LSASHDEFLNGSTPARPKRLAPGALVLAAVVAFLPIHEAAEETPSALMDQGRHADALRAYEAALEQNPSNTAAHVGAGDAALALKRFRTARAHYEKALALDGQSIAALRGMARVTAAEEDFDEAVEALRAAVRLRGKDSNLRYELARTYLQLGRDEEAANELTVILLNEPSHVPARRALGEVCLRQGQPDKAISHFQQLADAGQAGFPSLVKLALLYEAQRDLANAARTAHKALELRPESHDLGALLGRLAFAQGAFDDAVGRLAPIVSAGGGDRTSRLTLAHAYVRLDRLAEAATLYEKLVEENPADLALREQLAAVYEKMGRLRDAERLFADVARDDAAAPGASARQRLFDMRKRHAAQQLRKFFAPENIPNIALTVFFFAVALAALKVHRRRARRYNELIALETRDEKKVSGWNGTDIS